MLKRPSELATAFSVESVARELCDQFRTWRRAEALHAWTSITLGFLFVPVLYLVGFWTIRFIVVRLTYGSLIVSGPLDPVPLAVGGVWFLTAATVAWRSVDPLSEPQPPPGKTYDRIVDAPPVRLDRDESAMAGAGTTLRVDTLLAVMASGPRQAFEGFAALRDLPRPRKESFALAAQYLHRAASADGLTPDRVTRDDQSAQAMRVLWSLKLIRKDGTFVERWRIRATTLGAATAEA